MEVKNNQFILASLLFASFLATNIQIDAMEHHISISEKFHKIIGNDDVEGFKVLWKQIEDEQSKEISYSQISAYNIAPINPLDYKSIFMLACEYGSIKIVKLLIPQASLKDRASGSRYKSWTTLMFASQGSHVKVIKLLLNKDPELVHCFDIFNYRAIDLPIKYRSCRTGNWKKAIKFLQIIELSQADPCFQLRDGTTALMVAVSNHNSSFRYSFFLNNEKSRRPLVYALLKKGANPYILNNNGESAIDIARKNNFDGLADLMLNFSHTAPSLLNICKMAILRNQNTLEKDFSKLTLDLKEDLKLIDECAICLGPLGDDKSELSCGHNKFHFACLEQWKEMSNRKTCPLCKMNL